MDPLLRIVLSLIVAEETAVERGLAGR